MKRNEEHPLELKYWKFRVARKITSRKLKHMFLMWICHGSYRLDWIVNSSPTTLLSILLSLMTLSLILSSLVFILTSFDMNQIALLSTLVCPIVLKSMLISMDLFKNYKALSNNQHKLILFIENIVKTRKLGKNMYYMSNLF